MPPTGRSTPIELEPHRSVLEGILQAKARFDGSIGIRCSCRAAICGSCGVRINGKPDLACHTHLGARPEALARRRHRGRADGQHARHQGPHRRHGGRALEEDPPRHAVADPQAAGARARVHRAARGDGRRDAVDGLHPVRRLRVGLPVDGGRPGVHRARRRSRRPTASSATRATTSTASAWRTSPRTRTASTTARTAFSASTPARRASRR